MIKWISFLFLCVLATGAAASPDNNSTEDNTPPPVAPPSDGKSLHGNGHS